jgi:membrane protease YdiL (CAAX protease family)
VADLARAVALLAGLAALVRAVIAARRPGVGPLGSLVQKWFGARPSPGWWALGALAGLASVAVVPLVAVVGGWGRIDPASALSGRWLALAAAGVILKAAFVVFEEIIFRGALVPAIRRWAPSYLAVAASGLVFAAAHGPRPFLDLAILWVDGIGFGLAFTATGSLWLPVTWHLSKNLAVWLLFGRGTIDLVGGPLRTVYHGPAWLFGSGPGAGWLDFIVALGIVGLMSVGLLVSKRQGWN